MRPALIGDIGGTNARFALVRNGGFDNVAILKVADYASLQAAIEAYLATLDGSARPHVGAIAVAGPVTGDRLSFTNHPWSFSRRALAQALGFERLEIVNDFVAQALAVPRLGDGGRRQIGPGAALPGLPIGIVGPGTGLGVSSLIPSDTGNGRWIPVAGEGGHVTLAATTAREAAVIDRLHRNGTDHVSAERLICGPGLVTLYETLAELDGMNVPSLSAAAITGHAEDSSDRYAVEAVAMFCALLGDVAGNLALTIGARGGVYVAGGVVLHLGELFDRSEFRARFAAKGRMRAFLDPIPTYVMTHPMPALLGLAALVEGK